MGDKAQQIFTEFQSQNRFVPLVLTPAVFVAVVWITNRSTPDARGSGIPQVMAAGKDLDLAYTKLLSMPTAAAKLLLTVAMLLVGGSVGREGPTVQIAAAVMIVCHRLRSDEHTSELQSLMRISYAVFCL